MSDDLGNLLNSTDIDVNAVRDICRKHLDVFENEHRRLELWSLFLLGNVELLGVEKNIEPPDSDCCEQQVLEADIHRTRTDCDSFRLESFRAVVKNLLQRFCIANNIPYKQGMNEVRTYVLLIELALDHSLIPLAMKLYITLPTIQTTDSCTYDLHQPARCRHKC